VSHAPGWGLQVRCDPKPPAAGLVDTARLSVSMISSIVPTKVLFCRNCHANGEPCVPCFGL
jgi:hypothetical protein